MGDRVGESLGVQIWAPNFGKTWDGRILGISGFRPNGEVS